MDEIYCRYGVKLYPINQSINCTKHFEFQQSRVTICLFTCLFGVLYLTQALSLIWRRHHYLWKASNFDLGSTLFPLSNESSLACHTYCETGYLLILVISEYRNSDSNTCCRAFGSGAVTTCFLRQGFVAAGIWTPNLLPARQTLLRTVLPGQIIEIL